MPEMNSDGFAMSPHQRRLVSLDTAGRVEPYIAQIAIEVTGELDRAKLLQAMETVMRRHEILRTRFVTPPGLSLPLQVISTEPTLSPDLLTQSSLDHQGEIADDETLAGLPGDAFDLVAGQLIHLSIKQNGDSKSMMTLTLPALCADASSLTTIIGDLARNYQTPAISEAQAVQYVDVVEYLNEVAESEYGALGRQYWRAGNTTIATRRLKPSAPHAEPTDFRPRVFRLQRPISLSGMEKLEQAEAPAETFLLTCWQVLLCRLYGLDQVVIGYAADGRTQELDGCVGLFEKYIPIRLSSPAGKTFTETMLTTSTTLIEGVEWQETFQWTDDKEFHFTAFNYYDGDWAHKAGGINFRCAGMRVCSDRYCLKLNCVKRADGLALEFWYDPSVYEEREIRQLASQFVTLVESACLAPGSAIETLNLIGEDERRDLLRTLNSTASPLPQISIETAFAEQVELTPDATALLFGDRQISYGELNRRAQRMAFRLRELKVGPETRVALLAERGLEVVIGMLAVLKVGAAYVMLEATSPPERLAYLLEDSHPLLLLADAAGKKQISGTTVQVLSLDDDSESLPSFDCDDPESGAEFENAAYVLYTSGSTGLPKGVVVTRRGLSNYVSWARTSYQCVPGLRSLLHTSLSFDLVITGLWPVLLSGGCVVIVEELIGQEQQGHDFGIVKLTPSHLRILSETRQMVDGFARQFIIGGEALRWEELKFCQSRFPGISLINEYGPTETVVGCCAYWALPGAHMAGPVPIGKPIANTGAYVLKEWQELTPTGSSGELYIGGFGVARGYLNHPVLTAERFVPDGITGESGARLYRTGDQVKWRADQELEFLGRLDEQVKIHGYRVELGEISSALAQQPGVQQCLVDLKEDESGNKRLVAYIIPNGEARPTDVELRESLRKKLPDYMLPAAFVELSELPLTSNGKLDRRALPAPAPLVAPQDDLPQTQIEKTLADIWAKVLRLERVGRHQSFFELGGDSILSIHVSSRARQSGLSITPRQMFQHQTIAELAVVASELGRRPTQPQLVCGPLPLTPIQARFFEHKGDYPHHFNQSISMEAPVGADYMKLQTAVEGLASHHDALRATFWKGPDKWEQAIAETAGQGFLTWIDLTGLPPSQRVMAWDQAATELQARCDLKHGPLFRVGVFKHELNKPLAVLFIAHHLVMDIVSWQILHEDLELLYGLLQRGKPIELPVKTTSYRQWSEILAQFGRTVDVREEADYWLQSGPKQFSKFPQDHVYGDNTEASASQIVLELSPPETDRLVREVPRTYGVEFQHALIGVLVQVITEWSGGTGLLLDLEGHGREEEIAELDLSRTVGWFTSVYPVWFPRVASNSTGQQLTDVRDRLQAIPRRGLAYGILRYSESYPVIAQQLAQAPHSEIDFNYLGQLDHVSPGALDQQAQEQPLFRPAIQPEGRSKDAQQRRERQFEVNCWVSDGRLQVGWTYSRNYYRAETVQTLVQKYILAVGALIAKDEAPRLQARGAEVGKPAFDVEWLDKVLAGIKIRSEDSTSSPSKKK